jgi:hypothetical protein
VQQDATIQYYARVYAVPAGEIASGNCACVKEITVYNNPVHYHEGKRAL